MHVVETVTPNMGAKCPRTVTGASVASASLPPSVCDTAVSAMIAPTPVTGGTGSNSSIGHVG